MEEYKKRLAMILADRGALFRQEPCPEGRPLHALFRQSRHVQNRTPEHGAKAGKISVKLVGIGIAIDREQTTAVYDPQGHVVPGKKGKNVIQEFVASTGIPVHSVAGIRDVVEYLYKAGVPIKVEGRFGPIREKTKLEFDNYLKTYGIE